MKSSFDISSECGYTLIETVVAMALFLSVLIPLVGTIGNMMFDRKVILAERALTLAQSEMSETLYNQDFVNITKTSENGLVIIRSVERYSSLIEIRVVIKMSPDQPKELIVLKKIVIE